MGLHARTGWITLDECIKGHIYRVHSRNLSVAVYDGDKGFIGIRTKWGDRFLFTEDHWDTGEPHGTVKPFGDIGVVPDGVECNEYSKALFELLAEMESNQGSNEPDQKKTEQ